MNKLYIYLLTTVLIYGCNNELRLSPDNVNEIIAEMTLDEKGKLLTGSGMLGHSGDEAVVGETQKGVPGAAGTTQAISRLGIPSIVLADGPAGVRISPTREGTDKSFYCTAFPTGISVAASWNMENARTIGMTMGQEALDYGIDVILAPGMNIMRHPLCGRNYEYFSEDPVLSGMIGAAVVNGIQSKGVGTSIKHFVANNQETNRKKNNSQIDSKTFQELYLRGFKIALEESNPWTIMSSYNKVNGEYTSESTLLLTDILRTTWGYEGLVVTDWFAGENVIKQIAAGNDLIMPGTEKQQQAIVKSVQDGTLNIEDVDRDVKRVLELILKTPRYKGHKATDKTDLKKHAEISRSAASEGMVLLKNDNVLPFKSNLDQPVALFGCASYNPVAGGIGSGAVKTEKRVSLAEALSEEGLKLNQLVVSKYMGTESFQELQKKRLTNGAELEFESAFLAEQAKESSMAVVTLGRVSGEFSERYLDDDYFLSKRELLGLTKIAEAFHKANKPVVVVLNVGGPIETASWKHIPDAILLAWHPGQEGGRAIYDVLSGKVNPSGKLPMTLEKEYVDIPSSENFPVWKNKTQYRRIRKTKPDKNFNSTTYEEKLMVGYRYFDKHADKVSFPFGFGLSYTSFDIDTIRIQKNSKTIEVNVIVTNTGKVAGKEVVQVYADFGIIDKNLPQKELIGFAKTKLLNTGEKQTLTITIKKDRLRKYNPANLSWELPSQNCLLKVGNSSDNIREEGSINLN